MFKKLRNRLILINLSITTVVILIVFSTIYIFATRAASNRPPMTTENKVELYSDDVENIIKISIEKEKQAAAQDLLATLIISGLAIEFIVALISYLLAEEAIKPVKEAYESQKVFIANASHEIKTPLAAISANLEAADIHGNKWISNVEKETAKLTALNAELLSLARTDLIKDTTTEEVNLADLVSSLITGFEPRLSDIKIVKNITTQGKTRLSPADFSQIFNILMDNAIKYCSHQIDVSVSNHELAISNDGTAISQKDLEHIFERFYQADKSADGVGLGLSIAKAVAERNNWTIEASSGKHKTTFTLKF